MTKNYPTLTRRELEVLNLLAQDHTSFDLAETLYISFETVKTHRKNLTQKLGVKTTGGLVGRAYELGILEYNRPTAR